MPDEYFDALDCGGVKTGAVITRDEAHATGTWHGAFHCLIMYGRNNRNFAIFQKRAANKKIAPGKFDVSVGGHYVSGEDAETAGPREIKEELGLDVRFKDLVPIGRRVFVYCFTSGLIEYEFQDVFLLHRNIDTGGLALQREELDGVLEMDVDQGIELFSGKRRRNEGFYYPKSGSQAEPVHVTVDDFVPCLDNYYLKMLLLVRRYLSGERAFLLI